MSEVEAFGVFKPQKHGGGLISCHPGEDAAIKEAERINKAHNCDQCGCGGAEVRSMFKSWPTRQKSIA